MVGVAWLRSWRTVRHHRDSASWALLHTYIEPPSLHCGRCGPCRAAASLHVAGSATLKHGLAHHLHLHLRRNNHSLETSGQPHETESATRAVHTCPRPRTPAYAANTTQGQAANRRDGQPRQCPTRETPFGHGEKPWPPAATPLGPSLQHSGPGSRLFGRVGGPALLRGRHGTQNKHAGIPSISRRPWPSSCLSGRHQASFVVVISFFLSSSSSNSSSFNPPGLTRPPTNPAVDAAMDADVIARLYPFDPLGVAQRVIENNPRCVRPPRSRPQSRSSREPTVEASDDDVQANYLPYLAIKFSHAPRTQEGLVFGTDSNSDVRLPRHPGLSARHLAMTFKAGSPNGRYCLTLRDLGSTQGTTVMYGNQANTRRKRFDWIVAGPDFCRKVDTILIKFHDTLEFRLVLNHQDASSPAYRESVERFCRGAAGPDELMGALAVQSGPATRPITGTHTPPEDAIVIEQRGYVPNSSQVTTRFWNVSTGEECSARYHPQAGYDRAQWQMIVETLKRVSHVRSQLAPFPPSVSFCTHVSVEKHCRPGWLGVRAPPASLSRNAATRESEATAPSTALLGSRHLHGPPPKPVRLGSHSRPTTAAAAWIY